ncbi:MAG: 50S ribosomal protein L34e [Candidatus Woesearchaeota archaeon]
MVSGIHKSRSLRKVQVKVPSGETRTHYRQKQRSIAKCAVTKKPLRGIPRKTQRKFKNLPLSQKRVSRAYGGYMSHSALKEKILKEIVLNEQ